MEASASTECGGTRNARAWFSAGLFIDGAPLAPKHYALAIITMLGIVLGGLADHAHRDIHHHIGMRRNLNGMIAHGL